MSKIFNKYLSFLYLLLFTGVLISYASLASEYNYSSFIDVIHSIEDTTQVIGNTSLDDSSYNPIQHNNENKLFFDVVEIQEVEEEFFSKHHTTALNSSITSFFDSQLYSYLSYQLQKDIYTYKDHYNLSYPRLHVKLQVFII